MNIDELRLADYRPRSSARVTATSIDLPASAVIDCHNHLGRWLTPGNEWMIPDVAELVETMSQCGVQRIVNLDGRWGSELHENLARYDDVYPEHFSTFGHFDWSVFSTSDTPTDALLAQLQDAVRMGAKGIKIWKDLGLSFRDQQHKLVLPDDPRVIPVLQAVGDAGLPVLIHVADPVAFFAPLDEHNERVEELAGQPDWWFGAPEMPTFDSLLGSLAKLVEACPSTTFIGAHVGCAAEDLDLVTRLLEALPNFFIDLSGRMGELGRQPRAARQLILDQPDRVLFGTDVYPVSGDAYRHWYRFLETSDECFDYDLDSEIPTQGRWQVSALDLPDEVLPGLYAGNAQRVLFQTR